MPNFFGMGGLIGGGLKAGQLIHRMTIIGKTLVDLPNGGQAEEVTVVEANTPCAITPLTADERVSLGTQYAEATHQIRAHYTPAIQVTHQVRVNDPWRDLVRTFDLLMVVNVNERGRELNMLAVERLT